MDRDGQEQVTAINQVFLIAHLRILRSAMHDLAACGPVRQRLIRQLLPEHDDTILWVRLIGWGGVQIQARSWSERSLWRFDVAPGSTMAASHLRSQPWGKATLP